MWLRNQRWFVTCAAAILENVTAWVAEKGVHVHLHSSDNLLLLLQGDHGVLHQHDVGHAGAAQHMATHQRAAAKVGCFIALQQKQFN
jgi:hypothetical protein